MSKKNKKGQGITFKITPKTENEEAQVKELQIKKKILEEKYIISKTNREQAYQEMMEVMNKMREVKNDKNNEEIKLSSILADFGNNTLLVQRNYKSRLEELKQLKEERENKIAELQAKIEEKKNNHARDMDQRNKYAAEIRNNMDSLSKSFSQQLSEIQVNLQSQIDKISLKWETNFTEHMEKYKDHVKKYDIFKEI